MTPAQFIDKYAVRISEKLVDATADQACRSRCPDPRPSPAIGRRSTLPYFHGYGIDGFKAEDFILCIALDVRSAHTVDTFEEFVAEFGYDSDSLSAFGLFQAIAKQYADLAKWATAAMFADLLTVEEDQ